MSVTCDQIKAYATQFLPQFQFADAETLFPVSVDSWLKHCADGDWQNLSDPHRGTTVVQARVPLTFDALFALNGCQGVTPAGPVGAPINPAAPLPTNDALIDEFFIDFAGWSNLGTGSPGDFSTGDQDYTKAYFSGFFAKFNGARAQAGPPPPTRTVPTIPQKVAVYCEAAWAGDFTRASISNNMFDFATQGAGIPDKRLDAYLVPNLLSFLSGLHAATAKYLAASGFSKSPSARGAMGGGLALFQCCAGGRDR